ncbi:DUF6674 family protein [Agathobacter rectalis]|uniref:DUF6674 family protein n=1 Tax=Agathobacter rectalis TaxID=39491 RepID=UPI0036F3F399
MKQKLKRFMAGFMAMLTLVGTLFTNGTTAFAASPQANIAFWNASVKNSGEVSELKPGYNHGKILYSILDGNSAYCMNFGLRADGGQLMNSYDDASTSMSAQQRKLLSYCLYYGFNSTQKAAPSNSQCDEYIATQAMVWVIVADIFGTGSGDSAARKLCNTAPSPDSSYSYYERLNARCEQIKSQVSEIKVQVKSTAKNIVDETKAKGRAALYRVTEFVGIKKRLLNVRTAVKDMIVSTDRDIARTALLAKGLREAGQTVNNAFHTFADKPEVDYSQKEQKYPFTKAVLAPMKAVKKLLVSMELHLDASIDKLDNLAMNVRFDKEKRMEQTKDKEQKAPDTEREIIYSPMVAEPQEYKYNADAFEARKTSEAKQETAGKELPKVREDKAR